MWRMIDCFKLQMGDSSVEVTDENREASQEVKTIAVEAISEGTVFRPVWGVRCSIYGSSKCDDVSLFR